MRHVVLKLLAIALLTQSAFGWGAAGHMTIGAFAYDELAEHHPAELAKLLNVLHNHPEWARMQKRLESVPPEDRDRYAFMIAARWPDDIRQEPEFHHGDWHYIDNPFVPPGQHVPTSQPAEPNAITALLQQVDVLKGGKTGADQAVALCWVLHLVGDLHQPLHAVTLYSSKFPEGDKGGNLIYVRVPPDGATINLHQFWDGALGRSQTYRDTANTATELRHRPELSRDRLPGTKDGNPTDWAKESYDAAVSTAYLDGKLEGGTKSQGEMLPEDYAKNAKPVAEQRAALAGYRLTDTLVAAAKSLPGK